MGKGGAVSNLSSFDPEVYEAIYAEVRREDETLGLIASENFVSEEVLEAQDCLLTNKYAEGYPGVRWYEGCGVADSIEEIARQRAMKLFGAEHANVQPHSGSQANMAALFALAEPGDVILGMELSAGGHLTHGHRNNFSGRLFKFVHYGVSEKDEKLDYAEIERLAREHEPRVIIAGASAYPRAIDFAKFREICDTIEARLLVDMAHIAGLIAAKVHPDPVEFADVVTSSTHKTLRGPRGGFILCKKEHAQEVDKQVFPGSQGGPMMHTIAAKAVAFKEAMSGSFVEYQKQIVANAKAMAQGMKKRGYRLVSGGTDNHLFLVDVSAMGLTGKDAASLLDACGIIANKSRLPFDKNPPAVTSGLRFGTPALTTRGMKEREMEVIAGLTDRALRSNADQSVSNRIREEVRELTKAFPVYAQRRARMQKNIQEGAQAKLG